MTNDGDISDTLAPASEQLDAIELAGGPRVFTVERVDVKDDKHADQPVSIHLCEFPRPWRPSKNMRRVLAYCWGNKSALWTGRCMKLYLDPEVTFGKDKPGGTRIAALSHITKTTAVPILISQGRSSVVVVEPLTDSTPTAADVAACTDRDELRAMWLANPDLRDRISARVDELKAQAEPDDGPNFPDGDAA